VLLCLKIYCDNAIFEIVLQCTILYFIWCIVKQLYFVQFSYISKFVRTYCKVGNHIVLYFVLLFVLWAMKLFCSVLYVHNHTVKYCIYYEIHLCYVLYNASGTWRYRIVRYTRVWRNEAKYIRKYLGTLQSITLQCSTVQYNTVHHCIAQYKLLCYHAKH